MNPSEKAEKAWLIIFDFMFETNFNPILSSENLNIIRDISDIINY